jgi:hypothetical protein
MQVYKSNEDNKHFFMNMIAIKNFKKQKKRTTVQQRRVGAAILDADAADGDVDKVHLVCVLAACCFIIQIVVVGSCF